MSETAKICKDVERIRNAERLARALKPYLNETNDVQSLSTPANFRGRGKDKRICQLNAAYKYCLILESKIQDFYDKENLIVPDELKLVHSTLGSNNSDFSTHFINELFQTPIQKNSSLSNDESTGTVCSVVSSSTNTGVPVTVKRSNILSTISPICGPQDHYMDDGNQSGEFAVKRRRVSNENVKQMDFNNNVIDVPKSKEPVQLNNLEFRKHYFLRSTAIRIKNALSAASESSRRPSMRKMNNSANSSSRSSSLTTTPTEPIDEDNSSNISSLIENIDQKQLLKIDLPQEQLNKLFAMNPDERKSSFSLI